MRKKVVIVGAGFGGLYAALKLARLPLDILVVERTNHHTFQPLLYQVATSALTSAEIATPVRRILRSARNVSVLMSEVTGFDLEAGQALLPGGHRAPFDYLVAAAGARHSYFAHPEWEANAPGLKTVADALEIRRRMLTAFEDAENQAMLNGGVQGPPLNFVVIGGGPTGVELAGSLAELARSVVAPDYRLVDTRKARVALLESGPRVLAGFDEETSAAAARQLEELGVEVRTGALVTNIQPGLVTVNHAAEIPVALAIWAAGVQASPLGKALGAPLDHAGRVRVAPDLTVPGHPNVFVIGDLAAVECDGKPVPGVAPAAIQMGKYVARAIARDIAGQPRQPFRYVDKGSMAAIGRARGVARIAGVRLSGFLAFAAWSALHIAYLIGFRNRVVVMLRWVWLYFTYERAARLI